MFVINRELVKDVLLALLEGTLITLCAFAIIFLFYITGVQDVDFN